MRLNHNINHKSVFVVALTCLFGISVYAAKDWEKDKIKIFSGEPIVIHFQPSRDLSFAGFEFSSGRSLSLEEFEQIPLKTRGNVLRNFSRGRVGKIPKKLLSMEKGQQIAYLKKLLPMKKIPVMLASSLNGRFYKEESDARSSKYRLFDWDQFYDMQLFGLEGTYKINAVYYNEKKEFSVSSITIQVSAPPEKLMPVYEEWQKISFRRALGDKEVAILEKIVGMANAEPYSRHAQFYLSQYYYNKVIALYDAKQIKLENIEQAKEFKEAMRHSKALSNQNNTFYHQIGLYNRALLLSAHRLELSRQLLDKIIKEYPDSFITTHVKKILKEMEENQ